MSRLSFTFFVRSCIFDNGFHWEDNSPLEGIAFYVVAEDPKGNRWAHEKSWTRASCGDCDSSSYSNEMEVLCEKHLADPKDGSYSNEEAEAEGASLIARIEKAMKDGKWAGPRNNPHWTPIDPCYGSEAYSGADDLAREMSEEGR